MNNRFIRSIAELRKHVADWRKQGLSVGLVPTLGNLHDGHLALVHAAREQADRLVTSVFVNPLQFGEGEDFDHYPRTLEADVASLEATGNDVVFAPPVDAIYPNGYPIATRVAVEGLSNILCGKYRPGHFEGVTTVVCLLFNLVQPDIAVFGMKDYQQLTAIRRMVADLHMPVRVMGAATVREPSGLAMSSRNRYLTVAERDTAPLLYRTLTALGEALRGGDRGYRALEKAAADSLTAAGFRPDYVAIRDPESLGEPIVDARRWVVVAAAWLGKARLIDNVVVGDGDDGR